MCLLEFGLERGEEEETITTGSLVDKSKIRHGGDVAYCHQTIDAYY